MKKKKKGMTLVEIIAAMAILGIVSVAITSTLLMAVNRNADNKSKLYSNENSRTFIELIKTKDFRPEKPGSTKEFKTGWYYLAFGNGTDDSNDKIREFINSKIVNESASPSSVDGSTLAATINKSGRTNEKFVMSVNIKWNAADNVYDIDVYSWEVARDELSKISRKVLIAPQN